MSGVSIRQINLTGGAFARPLAPVWRVSLELRHLGDELAILETRELSAALVAGRRLEEVCGVSLRIADSEGVGELARHRARRAFPFRRPETPPPPRDALPVVWTAYAAADRVELARGPAGEAKKIALRRAVREGTLFFTIISAAIAHGVLRLCACLDPRPLLRVRSARVFRVLRSTSEWWVSCCSRWGFWRRPWGAEIAGFTSAWTAIEYVSFVERVAWHRWRAGNYDICA